jgi:predicted  nucleic acid-binding Zn-ribbon protein
MDKPITLASVLVVGMPGMPEVAMKLSKKIAAKLFVAVLAGSAIGSAAHADVPVYPSQSAVDDANARLRADQYALDQDRTNLAASQNSLASLTSDRDKEARRLDYLQHQASTPPPPAIANPLADSTPLKQQLDAAKSAADKAHDDAVAQFQQTDAWKQANDAFEHARKDLQGPTDAVFDRLAQTKDFQNLVSIARTAKMNADKLHDDPHADPKAVKQAQDAFTAADNRVQEMEEKTLQADATVMAGRKAVDAAQARLEQLRDQFEHNLASDPSFAPLVARIQNLQQSLDAGPSTASAQTPTPTVDSQLLQQEQARLNQMNGDVVQLHQDVDRLSARVQQDQDAIGDAQRDYAAAQNALAAVPPPTPVADAYAAPAYAPQVYAYAAPVYAPPVYSYSAPCYDYDGGAYLSVGSSPYYYGNYYRGGYSRSYGYVSSGYRGSAYRSVRSYSTAGRGYGYDRSTYSSRNVSRAYSDIVRPSHYSEQRYVSAPRSERSFDARLSESFSSHDSDRSDRSSHGHSH